MSFADRMLDGALESVLRRDRIVIAGALATLAALAWAYILWLLDIMSMGGMEMPDMRMAANPLAAVMIPSLQPWSAAELLLTFVMWAIMMIGMMTPSAAPMILLYARVARQAMERHQPIAACSWFAGGYLLTWIGFSLLATVAQWALERAALLNSEMAAASTTLGTIVLIAAGLYQWTPVKEACVSQCRSPLAFIQRHGGFRRDARGALSLGLRHGLYCVGCCWVLMGLLFVGGIMNVLWIAAISVFVLVEKIVPNGRIVSRAAGFGFVAAGLWMVV